MHMTPVDASSSKFFGSYHWPPMKSIFPVGAVYDRPEWRNRETVGGHRPPLQDQLFLLLFRVVDEVQLFALAGIERSIGDEDGIRSRVFPFQVHRIFSGITARQRHFVRIE